MSFASTLSELALKGNLRAIPADATDRGVTDLSSNDYLGLGAMPELREEFFETVRGNIPPLTSSASRLLSASQSSYASLESLLGTLYGNRSCLLFNSGYHANTGLLPALASEPATLILADKLVHASMIDGIMLSRAPFKRFRHNDFDRLETLLEQESDNYERIIVAVESVYSMDGDSADIARLAELKKRYPKTLLYVDEAHAFGCCGPQGLGLCMASGHGAEIDVIVGTFGKAAASSGAFCITSEEIREYAVNRARSFIFSTAIPPLNCAWTEFIVRRMTGMDEARAHLKALSESLHCGLTRLGVAVKGSLPSHITPLIVGDPTRTVQLSGRLLERGFKVLPIRTPTVPPGTERLRISLSASLSLSNMKRFINALTDSL